MRIFLAGATGVIGIRLIPRLLAAGHIVGGMTRSVTRTEALARLGAEPIVCDVYDAEALRRAVVAFDPDAVMHQLTDLPDDQAQIADLGDRNDRMRREGTRNLVAAAEAAGAERLYAQSIAWKLPPPRQATINLHERTVLDAGGTVIRYGQFYGPGTYYQTAPPPPPRIEIDVAAARTIPLLGVNGGIVEIVEDA